MVEVDHFFSNQLFRSFRSLSVRVLAQFMEVLGGVQDGWYVDLLEWRRGLRVCKSRYAILSVCRFEGPKTRIVGMQRRCPCKTLET